MSKFSLRSLATSVAAASLLATTPMPLQAADAPAQQFTALTTTTAGQNPLLRKFDLITAPTIDRTVRPIAAGSAEYEISIGAFQTDLKGALEAQSATPQVVTGYDLAKAAPSWNTPMIWAVARRAGDFGPVAICVEDKGQVKGYFNLVATETGAKMIPAQPLVQPQTVAAKPADGAAAGVCMPLVKAERAKLRAEYASAAPRGVQVAVNTAGMK